MLPFQNMSGDPEQEYFADGMVEEIITALSRIRWLFVIARNSTFTYKGQAVDVKQVGRELGVRYVLEGSVRKAGSRVRITGQLIDATDRRPSMGRPASTARSTTFSTCRTRSPISVAGVIEPALQAAEIPPLGRAADDQSHRLRSLPSRLRSRSLVAERTSTIRSLELLEQAIERDPHYGSALALAALRHLRTPCQRLD